MALLDDDDVKHYFGFWMRDACLLLVITASTIFEETMTTFPYTNNYFRRVSVYQHACTWSTVALKAPAPSSIGGQKNAKARRWLSESVVKSHRQRPVVDLRSDTVTAPSRPMLEAALTARTGDDVMSEDPTVLELEEFTAHLFGKEKGLYVPTGTMGNLLAILSHCHHRASEIIIGRASHICLWEGGNAANLGGVSSRQIPEQDDATFDPDDIRECYRKDNDDHFPQTAMLCLENTHNMMGGIVLTPSYITEMGNLARNELGIAVHIDGARIFNAAVAQNVSVKELCHGADSISVCLSKGLGAPLGSVLVGSTEMIRLARRARKRCGGGMRQAGVVAAMGKYALVHNVTRLSDDHTRAQRLAYELDRHGFDILRRPGQSSVDTNIVFFGLPEHSLISKEELCQTLNSDFDIKLGSGYGRGGRLLRAVTHMDVDDEGVDRAAEAIVKLCVG